MNKKTEQTISYDDLTILIKKCEELMKEKNSPLITFYKNHLLNDSKFNKTIYKTLNGNTNLNRYHQIAPEPTFQDLLFHVYFLPWDEQKFIPHYDSDIPEKYFHIKKKNKKDYYSRINERDNGDIYIASLNISDFVRNNIEMLNMVADSPKSEKTLLRDITNKIIKWSAMTTNDNSYEHTLIAFPLISSLSLSKKLSFFMIDLGIELFSLLLKIDDDNDDTPLIIPKEFLRKSIISLTKQNVEVEVTFDATTENVELKNEKYHAIFDVISLASDLAEITDEKERQNKIQDVISSIRSENRTFPNITARDFTALSNILKMFFKNSNTIIDTTLGELCDITFEGLIDKNTFLSSHKKQRVYEALDIIHKWSSYAFDFGSNNYMGQRGRFTILNYVSGEYTNPIHLAEAIRSGEVKGKFLSHNKETDTFDSLLIENNCSKQKNTNDYEEISYSELCDIPVTLEISSIFKKTIEYDLMSKKFTYYHSQLSSPNAQVIYSFIDLKRQDLNYPCTMHISYSDFKDSFVVEIRKARFLAIIENVLDELCMLGALKEYSYFNTRSIYTLTFND